MDLFRHARESQIEQESPLANRMRPRTLDEFVGQEHIVGPGRLLRRAIQADQLSSLIFYGPPGTGKTTLARIIANSTESHFLTINAVLAGVKQIREAIASARERRDLYNQRTTLFVDEVHRWNKAQQDALLPHVENGTLILIGATTENPYFEVNKALVSRSRIFQLRPLDEADLRQVARAALSDRERGYGNRDVRISDEALEHLVNVANGDARSVLNALELAVETTPPGEEGIHIDLAVAEESIQRRAVLYDKDGDVHYDTISAFIKSIRGSDPDAALYWLAKMVYAGEDPRFIFRRLAILAGEDIGLADPQAMGVVVSCWEAFERIGMPEGQFPLAEATLFLATAPKSNSTLAFFDALTTVRQEPEGDVPNHLKDHNRDAEGFGHGKGYLYPHAYRDHWVAQQYLPDTLQGKLFYQPGDQGYERQIRDQVNRRREEQLAAMFSGMLDEVPEVLTYTPSDKAREAWLRRAVESTGRSLGAVRDRIFDLASPQRHHVILDLHAGSGLLTWEALRRAPEGGVWAFVTDAADAAMLAQQAERLPEIERPVVLDGDRDAVEALRANRDLRFDRIVSRNPLTAEQLYNAGDRRAFFAQLEAWLQADGLVVLAQVVPRRGQRLYELVSWQEAPAGLREQVAAAEEDIFTDPNDRLVNWDLDDLAAEAREAGLDVALAEVESHSESRRLTRAHWERWFGAEAARARSTYAARLAEAGLGEEDVTAVGALYRRQLVDRIASWRTAYAILVLRPGTS